MYVLDIGRGLCKGGSEEAVFPEHQGVRSHQVTVVQIWGDVSGVVSVFV